MRIRFTPWTSVSPNQTAGTMAAWEDQWEDSLLIDRIVRADFLDKVLPEFNVMDSAYGATGDGSTDDASAIQSAINAAEAEGGGTVLFPAPAQFYSIESGLTVNEGVMLQGIPRQAETTTNANGTDAGLPAIKWNGAGWDGATAADVATTTMIHFISGTSSEYLFGGGVRDLVLYGDSNGASVGIRASSTFAQDFDRVRIRKMGLAGLMLDSANGVLSQSCRVNVHYTYGSAVSSNEESSHGVYVSGGDYAAGTEDALTTQHDIHAYGLVHDGSLVYLKGTDNCRVHRCHGVVNGDGHSIEFAEDAAPTAGDSARNNIVWYLNGPVKADSVTFGNVIHHWNSESISTAGDDNTIHASAQIHYTVIDYVDADLFQTVRYVMTDDHEIKAGEFAISNNAPTEGAISGAMGGWTLPVGATHGIGTGFRSPKNWSDGEITALLVHYQVDLLDDANIIRFRTKVGTTTLASPIATPDDDTTADVAASAATDNDWRTYTLTFSTAITYTRGQYITVEIQRLGGHVNDTVAGSVRILGASLAYKSDGPNNVAASFPANLPYKN